MRLRHKTQRGGEVSLQGDPLGPGQKLTVKVDSKGCFTVPDDVGGYLLQILGSELIVVPIKKTRSEVHAGG